MYKNYLKRLFLPVLAIFCLLVAVPAIIFSIVPGQFSWVTQVLFSILLFVASAWIGFHLNIEIARSDTTKKWLPFAEMACKKLYTINSSIIAMQSSQDEICETMKTISGNSGTCDLHHKMMDLQCHSTRNQLISLEKQTIAAASEWVAFIKANCEDNECNYVLTELNKWMNSEHLGLNQRNYPDFEIECIST